MKTPPGPVIECGVFEGAVSVALRTARGKRHAHFAADTFEGMPYDGNEREANSGFVRGYLAPSNRSVVLFSLMEECILPLIGKVEDTLYTVKDVQFSFVYIDLDLEAPTRFALTTLLPQIVKGGRVGLHDYREDEGYSLAGVARAVQSSDLMATAKWREVYRNDKRDAKFIFFERL